MQKQVFKLLIVDDIPENIKVLGNSLDREGYTISFATSGTQALEMVRRGRFDLILLDIMMPGMDGYHVCRELKAQHTTVDIPVIFITAKTEKDDIVKGFEAGAVDYVTKPFNTRELLMRVKTHLDLSNARKVILDQAEALTWANKRLDRKNQKLERAIREIETLKGLLPVCSNCKKIRLEESDPKEQDAWISLESYLHEHTAAEVTHSICPHCMALLYPDLVDPQSDA